MIDSSLSSDSTTAFSRSVESSGSGLRLLSLDGGGIRGLSELLILKEIMNRVKATQGLAEVPRPCEYFDMIGGTSTGGLIALMLGRLRMTVDDAIAQYGRLSGRVFGKKKLLYPDGRYKASILEEVLKTIIAENVYNPEERMLEDDTDPKNPVCKTFVCCMSAVNLSPRFFRTYEVPTNKTFNCMIWEAARATSAAPTFFKRIEIGEHGLKEPFIDGGVGRNNPTKCLLEEAGMVFPREPIACLISIGCGQADTTGIGSPSSLLYRIIPLQLLEIAKALRHIATDCEATAQDVAKQFKDHPIVYFRFNVEQGMQQIQMNEHGRLDEVSAHTQQYLRKETNNSRVNVAAQQLGKQPRRCSSGLTLNL